MYPWNHWRRRRLLTFFDDSSKISFLLLDIFTGSWKLMLTKSKYEINAEGEQVILYEFCFQTYTSPEFVTWSFYQSSLQKSLHAWLLPLSDWWWTDYYNSGNTYWSNSLGQNKLNSGLVCHYFLKNKTRSFPFPDKNYLRCIQTDWSGQGRTKSVPTCAWAT